MQTPTWLKPAITGAVVGGIATMALGFTQGGWYLGGTADKMAQKQSAAAVVAALVPVCVSLSKADPQTMTLMGQLAAIKSSYEQRDFVVKAGWATMPAAAAPNVELAAACAEMLTKTTQS